LSSSTRIRRSVGCVSCSAHKLNAYKNEDMWMTDVTNVVSFSGGRTSAYMVYLMEKMRSQGEISNVAYVFMDTGAEHPKTYEFIKNCVEHFDINLRCIRTQIAMEFGTGPTYREVSLGECGPDLQPWIDMTKKYGAPYTHGAFCTDRMKTTPYKKYCDDKFGAKNYITWLGIRSDETRRINLARERYRYLAEISPMTKVDINGWWMDMPFDLGIDDYLGNCVFCMKKSHNKIAAAMRTEPEMAKAFNEMLCRDDVRQVEGKTEPNQNIYRNSKSMDDIERTFSHVPDEHLKQFMKPGRGNCEESCEVFGCQTDLFGDDG